MSKLFNAKQLVLIAAVGVMCGMVNTAMAASSCTLKAKKCSTAAIRSVDRVISVRASVAMPDDVLDRGTVRLREHDANGKLTNNVVFEQDFGGSMGPKDVKVPTTGLYSCLIDAVERKGKVPTVSCTIN